MQDQQVAEIVKALAANAEVLIMDEAHQRIAGKRSAAPVPHHSRAEGARRGHCVCLGTVDEIFEIAMTISSARWRDGFPLSGGGHLTAGSGGADDRPGSGRAVPETRGRNRQPGV